MRPRINSFGQITKKELELFLNENKVYGFIANRDANYIVYTYNIMFRKNKEQPEMLFIKISRTSKFVLEAWTNKDRFFKNLEDLKTYIKL